MQSLRQWATLHITIDLGGGVNESGESTPYPFNIMRNAAASWPSRAIMGIEPKHRIAAAARWVQDSTHWADSPSCSGGQAEVTAVSTDATLEGDCLQGGIPSTRAAKLGDSVPLVQPSYVLVLDVDSVLSVNAASLSLLLAHHARLAQADGASITKHKLKWIIQAMEVRPGARLPSHPPAPEARGPLAVEADLLSGMQRAIQEHSSSRGEQSMRDDALRLVDCVVHSLPNATSHALLNSSAMDNAPAHLRPAVYLSGDSTQQLKSNGTVDIFHMRDYRSAYGGLMNISRWLPRRWCTPPQRTRYTIGFEPYALLPWPIVPFDERFHGHGYSKSSWWFDRCVSGACDLRALPEVFILARLSGDLNERGILEHSLKRNRRENVELFRSKVHKQRQRGYTCQHYGLCSFSGPLSANAAAPGTKQGRVDTAHRDRRQPIATHLHVGKAASVHGSPEKGGLRESPPPQPLHPPPLSGPTVHRSPGMAKRLQALHEEAMRE